MVAVWSTIRNTSLLSQDHVAPCRVVSWENTGSKFIPVIQEIFCQKFTSLLAAS